MNRDESVHADVPMPNDYVEMMRHYFPNLPLPAIRDAWLHHATPTEVALSMEKGARGEPQEPTPDYLEKCPNCNGPADNGFDRSWPDPNPYYCTKCMKAMEY